MQNPPQPLAYSINDAIAVSSIGRTRLYELIANGTLKTSKIGRRTLVNASSLADLVANGA